MIRTDEDDEFDRVARENALHEVYRLGQEIEESGQPYHFAKREWVGLTDEDEIDWNGGDLKSFAKAIEAKLKEKNEKT
jgi:hypothetical protein